MSRRRQSSIYMKLRVCSPSPQISISCRPESFASATLRQIAAGAFSRPPSPGAGRPVDVVIAGDARRQIPKSSAKVPAHALAEELLPAVAVLGHRRIGVLLLERRTSGSSLLVRRVHAGRRGEEEPLDPASAAAMEQVRVDQHREHAQRLVVLDEPHPAHVGREVVHGVGVRDRARTGIGRGEVEHDVLCVGET